MVYFINIIAVPDMWKPVFFEKQNHNGRIKYTKALLYASLFYAFLL
jgi:hypothetical protein